MINIIPNWLQNAVNFINNKFPDEEDVNMSILYGYDCVDTDENIGGFAVYNTVTKTIMLADYKELKKILTDVGELSWEDVKNATIMSLFHEYRHHQQSIYGQNLSEEDAESFAEQMYEEFIGG